MKLKLQFIIAAFITVAISISTVFGQANLTFSGGNGTPLSITLQNSVTYTTTSNCVNGPFFVFDEAGNPFSAGSIIGGGTASFSVNGGTAEPIIRAASGSGGVQVTVNDILVYGDQPGAPSGSTVILNAGTYTTDANFASAPPANGSFATFLTYVGVEAFVRCSSNGVAVPSVDTDADGVLDVDDNCPNVANGDQLDNDADGQGDVCDADDDNDGVNDIQDAFPFNPNESVDTDNDGIGNNADTDDDNDNQTDADEVACGSNPLLASSKSLDTDSDNKPNCVDTDDDNDGVLDTADNCPLVANPDQADFDLDGIGDTCDPQTGPPSNKEQCKNSGWMRFDFPRTFKNQGDCIQFVNTGK